MEEADLSDGLCRLCASLFFSKSGFFIFGDDQITNKIELYLQIQMIQEDYLPKNICSNCLSKIEAFHEFAENARKVQHSFHLFNDSNVYEVEQEENITQRIEIPKKVDSSGLYAKEEQQHLNLPTSNFQPSFTKVSVEDDCFSTFFQSTNLTPQNYTTKEISTENGIENNRSKTEEPSKGNCQDPHYTSIIKPIDMKHLTTPNSSQPNLFNLPNPQPNIFTPHPATPAPIVLDCSYSDDVMSNTYLDISAYPDMCEIEDININYKNSIKFEMGKHVSEEPPNFNLADASFVSPCIGMKNSQPPLHDQNDYFSNFEYKLKDAIKYPDFDIIKEITQNVTRVETPNSEQLKDHRNDLNIVPNNEVQTLCSTQDTNESKQQEFESIQTSNSNLYTMFESWNNANMGQYEYSQQLNQITNEPVITYDVIYLGDDIYAKETNDLNTKQVSSVTGSEEMSSVLRNRLLDTPEKIKEPKQVITVSEDSNNANTKSMANRNEMTTSTEYINYPNEYSSTTPTDSSYNIMPAPLLPAQIGPTIKPPTIQCKSLDKIIKDMKIAQPSIQCKSLDKIIKDMKIANRLSKLNKQSVNKATTNNRNTTPRNNQAVASSRNFSEQNKKDSTANNNANDQPKKTNLNKEIEEGADANDIREITIENTLESTENDTNDVIVETLFEKNTSKPCDLSNSVVNNNEDKTNQRSCSDSTSHTKVNTPQTTIQEIEQNIKKPNETGANTNVNIIDRNKSIHEQITDLRKSKINNTTNSNPKDKSDQNGDVQDKRDEDWKHIKCNKCVEVYESKAKFDVHYETLHKARPIYTCLCCNKSTSFYSTFKSHCYRRANLNRYRCNYAECSKSFMSKTCVETHIKSVHLKLGVQKYVCEFCGAMFLSRVQLESHLPCNQVDSVVSVCQTCGKIFNTALGMRQHVRRVHSTETYICDICAKSFHLKFNLAQHIKTHTSARPHSCPHCGKSYFERSHLQRHLKKHMTSQNFPCSQCPKKFKSEELIKCHEKTHNLCRPLQCEFCTKTFLTHIKLKEHINIHTGQRPYACKFCDLSFSNYPNWYKHMKRKHPDFPYTSRKIALSGAAQDSEREISSSQPVEEIAQDTHTVLDISINTSDKQLVQYTTPSEKFNSFDSVLDSGNSNSSGCNIFVNTTTMNMFNGTEYSFHQF